MVRKRTVARNIDGVVPQIPALFDNLIEQAQEDLQAALGDFQDLVEAVMETDPGDFETVNDGLLALLEIATEAGGDLTDLLAGIFGSWAEHLADNAEAADDLLRRLYDRFVDQGQLFRAMLRAFISAQSDFPKLFHELATRAAGDPFHYRGALEAVLLPLFFAGLLVLGADEAVEALRRILTDPSAVLRQRLTWLDLGMPKAGLSDWHVRMLKSDAFTLPSGIWMMAALIEALRQACDYASLLPDGLGVPNPMIQRVLGPAGDYIGQMVTDYLDNVDDLVEALIAKLLEGAENDFEIEWMLLQLARFTPVGILFLLVGTTAKLISSPAPWVELLLNPIEDATDLRVKRLPAPSDEVKYILFSDIHRDARSDARPPYQLGSIDHFTPNREIYLELLKHYAERGYVIIEAGDCEELWFHRDFSVTPDQKLAEIIDTHRDIYRLLAELHAEGRYFRVQGNHDSYLRDPDTFEFLRAAIETPGSLPFEIYDFLVIEGVKTMQDVPFFLGLDSEPNTMRRPMIVAHGHQWDFWNCDANNILGKLIVSAVVTPLDMLDDPLRDLAGISSKGSPALNFKQILGDLAVFNSWQSYEPAVRKVDGIQHMEDQERRFIDDVQYSETLASLMGMLIPLTTGPNDSCGFPYLDGHCLFNLMSLGHTHNPHNEPYYDLKVLPYVKEALEGLEASISAATMGLVDVELGLVKSNYLNTGMTGWYEDCIWAIDLGDESHNTGQPKLIYWTRNTRLDRPNHMDWELPHIPHDGAATPGDQVDSHLRELLELVSDLVEQETARALEVIVQAPLDYVTAEATKSWKPADLALSFPKAGIHDAAGMLLFQCMLGLLPGQSGSFKATVDLPPGLAKALHELMPRRLSGRHKPKRKQLALAIGTLSVVEEMGRAGLRRTLGTMPDPEGYRACLGILALLAQLQQSRSTRLDVTLELNEGQVVAEVTIAEEERPNRIPGKKPRKVLPPRTPSGHLLAVSSRADQRQGLVVKAYVARIGTPLHGWTVAVEQRTGRRYQTIARVRTNRKGEAQILRLRPTEYGLLAPGRRLDQGEISLVLYSPQGKEVIRRKLDTRTTISRISLPVSHPILRDSGFYTGTKVRTVAEKTANLCAAWQKRLGDRGDPHVQDDLGLHDLILDTLAGLADPQTPLQQEILKSMSKITRKTSAIKAVAEYAGRAQDMLRECLGDDYVACDGTGSLRELGERLLKDNGRFAGLKGLFDDPVPDPEDALGDPKAGLGLPRAHIQWVKKCVAQFENGAMDADLAAAMAEYYPAGRVLAPPSVNLVEVWDGGFGGGEIVRRAEIHDKVLNMRVLKDQGGSLEVVDQRLEMDVQLDSQTCLVLEADDSGRQALVTDIRPGQKVTLYGSGFVSSKARLHVDYRAWEAETSSGRLVPDHNVLPADGMGNLEVEVHGQLLPIGDDATPTTYNGDKLVFAWPEAASREGLYGLRVSFVNESEYPTSIIQNEDCTLTIDKSDMLTQEILFAVLPPVNTPAVRVIAEDVECFDLTDPEGFLGIPWPDDLQLNATALHQRIILPTNGGEPTVENRATIVRQDDTLFWGPATWTPALRVFPEHQTFAQLASLDYLLVDFELLEVEGDLDRFVIQLLYIAALVTLALVVAAVIIAVVVGFVAVGVITAGTAEVLLPIVLGFVFGAAFSAFLALTAAMNAIVDGSDRILSGQTQLDGSRLMLRLSPVRFHRTLYPVTFPEVDATQSLVTMEEVFENEALGGRYELRMLVEAE